MPSETEAVLRALQERADAMIERQLRVVEGLSRKAERMMALGVTALAGTIALGAFALTHAPDLMGPVLFGLLIAGGGMTLAALAMFVEAYVGIFTQPEFDHGVSPATLVGEMSNTAYGVSDQLGSVVVAGVSAEVQNAGMMRRSARTRRHGVLVLLLAVSIDAIAFLYVLAGGMLW